MTDQQWKMLKNIIKGEILQPLPGAIDDKAYWQRL